MKNFIIFITLLAFSVSVEAQINLHIDTYESQQLAPGVKTVSCMKYIPTEQFGKIVRGGFTDERSFRRFFGVRFNTKMQFNAKGKLLSYAIYDSPIHARLKGTYVFDEKGRVIEEKQYNETPEIKGTIRHEYSYNDEGFLVQEKMYNIKGEYIGKLLDEHDSHGNLISHKRVTQYGELEHIEKHQYEYDYNDSIVIENFSHKYPTGDWIDEEGYKKYKRDLRGRVVSLESKGGNYFQTASLSYGWNEHLSKRVWYDENSKQTAVETYLYDEDGKVRLYSDVRDDSSSTVKEYQNGILVSEKRYNTNGKLEFESRYNNGLLISLLENDDEYKFEYKFDSKGSWTKCIEYKNTIPIVMAERSIEYW